MSETDAGGMDNQGEALDEALYLGETLADHVSFIIEFRSGGHWQSYGVARSLEAAQTAVDELSEHTSTLWRIYQRTVSYEPQPLKEEAQSDG